MSAGPARKVPYHLFVIFFILSLAIALTGYFFYQNQKRLIRADKQNELSAIADLKIRQIANWREERMKDASFIFNNEEIAEQIKRLGKDQSSPVLRRETLGWMTAMFKNRQYKSMRVVTNEGKVILSVPEGKATISPSVKAHMAEALGLRKIFFSDLYRDADNVIYLDIIIPILVSGEQPLFAAGSVILRIIPHDFLYPLIQSWPMPSASAETMLIGRQGGEVVYLNELRHRKNTALTLRHSLNQKDLPAGMDLTGGTGVIEGNDYRGIPVLAVLQPVPDSPWFMVAKIDMEEVFAPHYVRFRLISILVSVLILSAGIVISLFWRHQQATFLEKQHESELRHRDHLEALVKERTTELEGANIRLQEIDRLKSMFIASMSHELRTPLNSIIGFTGIMLQGMVGPLNEEQQRQLEIVKNSARHLLALINDVIDLSKIEAGKVEIIIEEFDVSRAITEVYDSFKTAADKKNVGLTLTIPDKLILNSDKRRVQQVVMNLVSNAVKFTDKGSVKIEARIEGDGQNVKGQTASEKEPIIHTPRHLPRDSDFLEIIIADTGIGIKEEDRDKLFRAFSRIHLEGAPMTEGTGLGLYLSKKIAYLIGGEIEVESEFGKGSVFRLLLPLRKWDQAASSRVQGEVGI